MESSKLEIPANYVTGILGASGGYDEGHLISAEDSRRFCGVATFLKAPLLKDVAEPTVGFVGIPFDGGSSRTGGSQFGPRGVREASFRVSGYNSELDVRPYDIHNLADCGDMLVSPFSITDTYRSIELGLKSLLDRGIVPIADRRRSLGHAAAAARDAREARAARAGAFRRALRRVRHAVRLAVSLRQRVSPRGRGETDPRRQDRARSASASTITRARSSSSVRTASSSSRRGTCKEMGADIRSKVAARLARLEGPQGLRDLRHRFRRRRVRPGRGQPGAFRPHQLRGGRSAAGGASARRRHRRLRSGRSVAAPRRRQSHHLPRRPVAVRDGVDLAADPR